MAKELGLEQVIGQRRAIDIAKAPFAPRAELMQGAGNELLARTAFPRERSVAGNSSSTFQRTALGRAGVAKRVDSSDNSRGSIRDVLLGFLTPGDYTRVIGRI
jgi:hypothetical protein